MGKTNEKKYNKYPRDALEKAIKAVEEGRTCSGAAKEFGVPRKTLAHHVSGKCRLDRRAGRECNIPTDIENAIVDKLVAELKLKDKPESIWNCDETGLQFSPDSSRIVAEKGERSVNSRCSPSKESVTTLVTINAAGQAMPPLCVVKGKTSRALQNFARWTRRNNVFLKHCGPARPQLLVPDSHHSHEMLDMLELAQQEDIHVMALPPHTTHALQLLDKVVFKPFKTAYKRVCTEFLARHPSLTINKATWPRLLKQTWDSTMREGLLKKTFEATGIYPVDRSRIPDSVFSASDAIRSMVPVADAEERDNLKMVPKEKPLQQLLKLAPGEHTRTLLVKQKTPTQLSRLTTWSNFSV
ncbi:hypothetical protein EGW08_020103 [Elysia chlorotica]|uniref:HTH psq-type domain-containing protein n=1 Tax=Elysia chlorotica TaxID=188477 RepID=A0A433SS74_ELYCH|nr:hypothetical protein EGW08_020103 [Elysia chlorotica]